MTVIFVGGARQFATDSDFQREAKYLMNASSAGHGTV
jgi:hypothetical protein